MPVSPAFRDSHLAMSLHWLVSSFFALSFLFRVAAAADARRRPGKKILEMTTTSPLAGGARETKTKSADDHVTTTHRATYVLATVRLFSAAVMAAITHRWA